MEELQTVGKAAPRIDAYEKVTGKAQYTGDFTMAGMLYGKILRSPYAHARILDIDTSAACAVPGVLAVVTPDDMPVHSIAPFLADQWVLPKDGVVRCVGEPVAAVAAVSLRAAEEAINLIRVAYEELPAVLDVLQAFGENPPVLVHPDVADYRQVAKLPIKRVASLPNVCQSFKIKKGNCDVGFAAADLVVEHRYTTTRVQHVTIEPHVAMAWIDHDGTVMIRSTNQLPNEMKTMLGEGFDLPLARMRMLSPYVGGGFGGKGGQRLEAVALLLAQKSGRPVQVAMTREEMFVFGGHRIPFTVDIKDGVTKDGTLLAREMRVLLDVGAYSDMGPLQVKRSAYGAVGTYSAANFSITAYGVYTNTPLTGALRGFGCAEVEWATELQMDAIARALGLDPVHVRRVNLLQDGEKDVSGMVTRAMGAGQCLDAAAEWIGWGTPCRQEPGPWRRGKGISVGSKSTANGLPSAMFVKVWNDCTVEVRYGFVEIGQGTTTVMAQIAAEEFGLPLDRIKVVGGDTAYCPFDYATVASRAVVHSGNALREACRDAKEQLFIIAAEKLDAPAESLGTKDGKVFVKEHPERSCGVSELFSPMGLPAGGIEIMGKGSFVDIPGVEDPATGQNENPVLGYAHAASAAEVAVNVETGEVKILRFTMACDVGKAMNPGMLSGQIEGGIMMGIGHALYEQCILRDGAVANASLTDYHVPTSLDMPSRKDIQPLIVEAADPKGPYGAKGAGELVLITTAPAVANAVYDAVGVRIRDLPLTKEKVLAGIKEVGLTN